ncbi:transcriptional regulatory protein GAL4 [Hypoxylon crocopeplum]|nr:transcriptional regulatory protein GAL4 [Hypoxylon crocopeplum]
MSRPQCISPGSTMDSATNDVLSDGPSSPIPRRAATRRPRVARACIACQQKKQKCDGGSPACRNCIKANRSCLSHDPSTNRRHPRNYVDSLEQHNASLEQHVAVLEGALRELHPNLDIDNLTSLNIQSIATTDGISAHGEDLSDMQARSRSADSPTFQQGGHADDISNLDLLCLRAAGGDPHYFGTSSDFSLTKLFSATLRGVQSQGPGLTMGGISNSTEVLSRPLPTPIQLPERPVLVRLTSAYFDQAHPQFPLLHRPTYLEWEGAVLRAREKGEIPNPTHLFFVYAVAAVGALTLTDATSGDALPEGLYASAERLFEHVIRLNSLESIQAILCCAMYSIRSPVGVSVWTLSGLALRQCIELGLHRKIPWSKVEHNVLKSQMRRRVFWCSYNLDRAVAITLGRPVGINDSDIDVEYPLDIDDENITVSGLLAEPRTSNMQPVTTVSSSIHTIRARQIWGRIQGLMYPQIGTESAPEMRSMVVQSFRDELKDWLDTAPDQLPSNRAYNNAFGSTEWFELMYHHSILLLHRHSLVSYQRAPNQDGARVPAFLECAQAGERICMLYRQLYITQRLNDTWGALHVLFLGSVTFLYCLWMSPETRAMYRSDKVSATCTSCMVVLAVMSERWAIVRPYRDTFDMLASATQTMFAESQVNSSTHALPALSSGHDQLSSNLTDMAELGMCSSLEALLSTMIQ